MNSYQKELDLINIATFDPSDSVANAAMKQLRKDYDPTYMFCLDCDGLVVKEKECCLDNAKPTDFETVEF